MPMNHTELQDATVQLLGFTGWRHLHVRRSIGKGRAWVTTTNIAGWPDLMCWTPRQPGRFLAVEVKVPPDWLSDDQRDVLAELATSGFETYVLTEARLDDTRLVERYTVPAGVARADLLGLAGILRPR